MTGPAAGSIDTAGVLTEAMPEPQGGIGTGGAARFAETMDAETGSGRARCGCDDVHDPQGARDQSLQRTRVPANCPIRTHAMPFLAVDAEGV